MKPLLALALMLALAVPRPACAYAIETAAQQAIIIDESTQTVLFEKNADAPMHPSSMSKLMTIYMVFKRLHDGSLKLADTMQVSEKAWRMQGSKMFVELGNSISVEDLLRGIIIQSGNDACVVIAEGLAGSEEAFADQMNKTAGEIGLKNSHFTNSTGWTDDKHLTTARDLAHLAHRLAQDFPELYHYFAEPEFVYHGIRQQNRNPLLGKNMGVDGLKTGHTETAGYGITVSGASPDGRRIILVVNGLTSEKERAEESARLLSHAYRDFENVTVVKQGEALTRADVWLGKSDVVALTVEKDAVVTLPKARAGASTMKLVYEGPIPAPVKKGDKVAALHISYPGMPTLTLPLVAAEDVDRRGPFGRIWPALKYTILGH